MKLILSTVSPGLYNARDHHAYFEIVNFEVHSISENQLRHFFNINVLPILKSNFKSSQFHMDEFIYDDQGAPLSLVFSSTVKTDTNKLTKALNNCLELSENSLAKINLPKPNTQGFFGLSNSSERSEESSEHLVCK